MPSLGGDALGCGKTLILHLVRVLLILRQMSTSAEDHEIRD